MSEIEHVDPGTGEVTEGNRRPFMAVLREQRNGMTHSELTDSLSEVVQAVLETGKAGSLTLTMKVSLSGDGAVIVTDDVKVKVPQPERKGSVFFADQFGNLSRSNPNQPELPLREVAAPAALKEVM